MVQEILRDIEDRNNLERDLLIDELSTQFEYKALSEEEQYLVLTQLIKLLKIEEEDSVVESIFNLFAIAFFNGSYTDLIVKASVNMLHHLRPGSLVHALMILGESNLQNKNTLIEQYLESNNPAVRNAAQEALNQA